MTPSIARSCGHDIGAGRGGDGREEIDFVHQLVRDAARRNSPGPADQARRSDAALHDAVVETRPGSRRSAPRPPAFGAVVGAPEHDRRARDAEPIDGIEHAADVVVHLGHRVGDIARAGLPDEVGMGQRREVNLRHRVIEEEGLPVADAALHERDGLLGRLAIDGAARLQIERLDVARRRSGPALPDERRIRRGLALCDRRLRLVAGARDAVVLIEALLRRVPILRRGCRRDATCRTGPWRSRSTATLPRSSLPIT